MDTETKSSGMMVWYSWKSPVGLGFFLATAALALVLVIYAAAEVMLATSASSQSAYPYYSGMDQGSTGMMGSSTGA